MKVTHKDLDPLFIIPSMKNHLLPPVIASDVGPKLALDSMEMVPEHPEVHITLGGLILVGHLEVADPVQDDWQALGAVGGLM